MEDLLGADPPEVSEFGDLADVLWGAVQDLAAGFAQRVPLLVLGMLVLILALIATRLVMGGAERGMRRAKLDHTVERLVSNLLRVALVSGASLLGLSVAGISVRALLAGIGLAGLALAFALQNILENFVAGILILMRRPFRCGDEIVTNEFEGTVLDRARHAHGPVRPPPRPDGVQVRCGERGYDHSVADPDARRGHAPAAGALRSDPCGRAARLTHRIGLRRCSSPDGTSGVCPSPTLRFRTGTASSGRI